MTTSSWKRRLAIVSSIVWIITAAAISMSYGSEFDVIRMREVFSVSYALTIFLLSGVLPMVVVWGGFWVLAARRFPLRDIHQNSSSIIGNGAVTPQGQEASLVTSRGSGMGIGWVLMSFDGRIGRLTFLKYWLLLLLVGIGATAFIAYQFPDANAAATLYTIGFLLLWPNLAILTKRLHDRGRSFLFALLLFMPIIGLWVVAEAFLLKGQGKENKYGIPQR